MGALDNEELLVIEGSENWRSTPDDLEEREKWPEEGRKTLHRRHTQLKTCPSLLRTGMSTSGDELSLKHLHCRETRLRCMITGTSTTVGEVRQQGHRPPCQHCNCGTSTVFCSVTARHRSLHNNWHATTVSKNCTCGLAPVFCTVCTAGKRLCVAIGMSSTMTMNWIWCTSTFSYDLDYWSMSLMIAGTSTTERNPPAPPPLKSSAPPPQPPPPTVTSPTHQYRPGGEDMPLTGTSIDSPARAPRGRAW